MNVPLNNIKNIIFDLGGVIINIDYAILIKAFSEIGLPHFETCFSQKEQRKLFDLYEKGLVTSQYFREQLKKECKPGTSDINIDAAWNSMLLDIPRERLELLMKVKNIYRTFLLSNTNEIHMNFIHRYLNECFQVPDFKSFFEKVYLSYEIQMRKPDPEIFEYLINQNKLKVEETLFIDDSPQHVESAKKLGLQAYLLDVKKQSVIDLF